MKKNRYLFHVRNTTIMCVVKALLKNNSGKIWIRILLYDVSTQIYYERLWEAVVIYYYVMATGLKKEPAVKKKI